MKRQTEYKYYGIQYIKQTEEKCPPPCTISIISKPMKTIFVVLDNFGKCTVLNKNSKAKRVKRMRERKKNTEKENTFSYHIFLIGHILRRVSSYSWVFRLHHSVSMFQLENVITFMPIFKFSFTLNEFASVNFTSKRDKTCWFICSFF